MFSVLALATYFLQSYFVAIAILFCCFIAIICNFTDSFIVRKYILLTLEYNKLKKYMAKYRTRIWLVSFRSV